MSRFQQLVTELADAAHDPDQLAQVWAALMKELLRSPLWSITNPEGKRIPWRVAKSAKNHPSMQAAFASPGLYLFGSTENVRKEAAGIPRYVGMTEGTLGKRLFGRYLPGERSRLKRTQCELADTYRDELRDKGIDGFPTAIRDWYRGWAHGSTVRLEGAVDFARHGIDGIWVGLLPISKKELVEPLEETSIPIANQWNIAHGYQPLVNKQDRVQQWKDPRREKALPSASSGQAAVAPGFRIERCRVKVAYLDIETSYVGRLPDPELFQDYKNHKITVIGIRVMDGASDSFYQLVGEDISKTTVMKALEGVERIVTYNGRSIPDKVKNRVGFDFPVIAAALGIVLDRIFKHIDLVPLCWKHGLYGGQKKVEETLGLKRQLAGKNGAWADETWKKYKASRDVRYWNELLAYNKEDVFMLRCIEEALTNA